MSGMDASHSHVFLGAGHAEAERRTWTVIALCTAMMLAEIAGGTLFGSIALIADGLHMSTHAGALLLAALAYRYARTHTADPRFAFGTGKLGDLAGYTSAIVLALIAALIAFEAASRFVTPVPIHFREAIPIASLGLVVNVVSAWLLMGGGHRPHGHPHGHPHGQRHGAAHDGVGHAIAVQADATWADATWAGVPQADAAPADTARLDIMEDGVPPVFRLRGPGLDPARATVEIERPDGTRHHFAFALAPDRSCLLSPETIPEPHEFTAILRIAGPAGPTETRREFREHDHAAHRDNNLRAAVVHVMADAAVSLMVIVGLGAAAGFGWDWMDPLVGLIGAGAIVSWAWTLIRDTGAILLDMTPDAGLESAIRALVAGEGDQVADLHLWRLGPGHLGAILAVTTASPHDARYYHARLARFPTLSHVTVEIRAVG
ncbi:MAG: CDF family Co(II)/Ni(II) efflux transporter DmeF [Acetobacteraceae bacterium]